ncbi:hypothetical protein KUV80_13595 [Fictibacillus nanhaiensis]|uniref:hypothetical protein n=1 Tax=Fictibacillus nanhaiensis TaxID=742169 RepID=UPI001C9532CD|nr:hypothetical protein [Fictibacillus nanhaiensis]MBY6037699.1 hypothetical protein [Fictibacillus nanhaiensis]
MLKFFYIVSCLLIISLIEIPQLKKKEFKRERMFYIGFVLLGSGLLTANLMGVAIPNPLKAMEYIYTPISEVVYGFLT